MKSIASNLADVLRALPDFLLLGTAVLVIALGASAVVIGARSLQRRFRRSVAPSFIDWTVRRAPDGADQVVILKAKADSLGLQDGQVVDLFIDGAAGSEPLRFQNVTITTRLRQSKTLEAGDLQFSPNLWDQLREAREAPGQTRSLNASVELNTRRTPYWNHPDPTIRYHNRMTLKVTALTTALTTILAVLIEIAI